MIQFTLTDRQAERLRLVLWDLDDKGPAGEGWQSPQLKDLCHAVGYPVTWGNEDRRGVDFASLPGDDLPPVE